MQGYLVMQDGSEHRVGEGWPEIECFRCGICCARYRPRVTSKEIDVIARKLGMSAGAFVSAYVKAVPTKDAYILQSSADTCPFLSWAGEGTEANCTIHLFRPKACRNWVASLSRTECREGLARLKANSKLLLPSDIYGSGKAIEGFSEAMRDNKDV